MEERVADLRCKEVISITDGKRYGYVGDVEIDLESGRLLALVVPGRLRFFGLLGREEDRLFPWDCIRRFGEDIILVEDCPRESLPEGEEKTIRQKRK
ncbi:MAG: YlmC/YmxH family sporulation protein [Clostridiales bacterium]|nr:YlmC/YmxH family sporulation protein [Clostridiales bacterium]